MKAVRVVLIVGPFAMVIAWVAAVISPTAGDFFQFWFAGHLVATGASPYDQSEWVSAYARYGDLASVVRHNCPTPDALACRWVYPPWTGWFLAPFGVFDPEIGIALEGLTFLTLLAAGVLLVIHAAHIGPDWLRAIALAAIALSAPFLTDALGGHFDGLMLVGLSLVGSSLGGGRALPLAVAAPILALKPHLFLAFGPLVLLWLLRERRLRLVWPPAAVLTVLVVVGLAGDPRALSTLTGAGAKLGIADGTVWSLASRSGALAPVIAAALVASAGIGAAAAVAWSSPGRRAHVFVASAAAFSLAVAPYSQLYDHLLLVPAVSLAVSFASVSGFRLAALGVIAGFVAAGWAAHAVEQVGRTSAGLIPVAVLIVLAATTYSARRPRADLSRTYRLSEPNSIWK